MAVQEVLAILARHREELQTAGVKSLAVFGSLSRGEATPESDIDLLVEFSRPVGLLAFIRLRRRLTGILGRPVDLATPKALRPAWRDHILNEALHLDFVGQAWPAPQITQT
jgi:uncharacterized protein